MKVRAGLLSRLYGIRCTVYTLRTWCQLRTKNSTSWRATPSAFPSLVLLSPASLLVSWLVRLVIFILQCSVDYSRLWNPSPLHLSTGCTPKRAMPPGSPRLRRNWIPPAEFVDASLTPKWIGSRAHGKTTQFDLLYRAPVKKEDTSKGKGGKGIKRPAASFCAAGFAGKKQKQLSIDQFKTKWLNAAWCSAALLAVEKRHWGTGCAAFDDLMLFFLSFFDFSWICKNTCFCKFLEFSKFAKLAFFASFSDSPNLGNDGFLAFSHFLNISAWRQSQAQRVFLN